MSLRVKFKNMFIVCCHSLYGCQNDVLYYESVNRENADELCAKYNADIVFVGHSHVPAIMVIKKNSPTQMVKLKKSISFKIELDIKYIINPGSVGAPRQKGIYYSYAALDTDNMLLSLELVCS